MILKFKTHFPWCDPGTGEPEPTHFVAKVGAALSEKPVPGVNPKWHTIRRIKNKRCRFRPGMKLQMATGPRFQPDVFAETSCTAWQHLKLDLVPTKWGYDLGVRVCYPATIPYLLGEEKMHQLAINDGFKDLDSFNRWFLLDLLADGPGDFELVGWGDKQY